jgi:uncharacterized cupin superfamily protein
MAIKFEIPDQDIQGVIGDLRQYTRESLDAMMDELAITGTEIESTYKQNVPVDTGRLISSIHTETSRATGFSYNDQTGQVFQGTFQTRPGKYDVIVGSNVEYAGVIEDQGGKIKGKQALENAYDLHTKNLPDKLLKAL